MTVLDCRRRGCEFTHKRCLTKAPMRSMRFAGALLTMATVLAYSGSVCAQAACQGNFVLPFDVQWNGRTLPAGQYHFTLSSATLGGILFIRDAQENGKMMAMTKGIGKI